MYYSKPREESIFMNKVLKFLLRFVIQFFVYSLLLTIFEFENGFVHILKNAFIITCGFVVADFIFMVINRRKLQKRNNDEQREDSIN